MSFYSFFKRKKKDSINIYVGQQLFTKNNEIVIIRKIKKETIIINYKNNEYERDINVIGKTLFLSRNLEATNKEKVSLKEQEKSGKIEFQRKQEKIAEANLQIEKKIEEDFRIKMLERERLKEIELKKKREKLAQEKLKEIEFERKRKKIEEENFKKIELERKREKLAKEKLKKLELEKKREKLEEENLRIEKLEEQKNSKDFIENVTPLYHNIFGEGVFVKFDNHDNIHVKFNTSNKIIPFSFFDAMDIVLFSQKTEKMLKRSEFLKNKINRDNDLKEQKYFEMVCEAIDKKLLKAEQRLSDIKQDFNDFSSDYNPHVFAQNSVAEKNVNIMREVRRNPYFARVDHGEKSTFYIGKKGISNFVVDWRKEICHLYYQYNIYIGNPRYNLSLVRDFDILAGTYNGFSDKYNRDNHSKDSSEIDAIISDKFLLKIIKENRRSKKASDIILTIQKNQYEIITLDNKNSILVLGCAGSGKTMIMLHRLSYILFNNKININDIFVISPTQLLNLENDELSKTLDINSANRLTAKQFNIRIIYEYYKKNETFNSLNLQYTVSNSFLNDNIVKLIYSDNFLGKFKNKIIDVVQSDGDNRQKFIKKEEERLLNDLQNFYEKEFIFDNLDEAYKNNNKLNTIYDDIIKIVSRLPIQNTQEKITAFENSLKNSKTNDSTLFGKKEVLETLLNGWKLSDKTVRLKEADKKRSSDISIKDEIFNEVFSSFDVLSKNSTTKNKKIINTLPNLKEKHVNLLQLITKYKEFVDKKTRFEEFIKRKNNNYFSEIVNQFIFEFKEANDVDCNVTFEFEIFLHLLGCSAIFENLHDKQIIIFLDEFQDYAGNEILLYKKIFPNATFNLFGDMKQKINYKDFNRKHIEQIVESNWNTYNIKENYRNSYQITSFINAEFKMDMTPIGIDGQVTHFNMNELKSIISFNNTDRTALIVKSMSIYYNLSKKYGLDDIKKINIIDNEEAIIKKGVLNIIPINLIKGLEFEKVYVILNEMNENQKYVAYTRALNDLYIATTDNDNE